MRYQMSAATFTLILILAGYIAYEVLTSPSPLITFTNTSINVTSNSSISGYKLSGTQLLGVGPYSVESSIGTFSIYFQEYNETTNCGSKELSASIFSYSTYILNVSNYSHTYLSINATPSGTPSLSIYNGENKIFSGVISSPIHLAFPLSSSYTKFVLSLNGFAFSQSLDLHYCIIKTIINKSVFDYPLSFETVPGVGQYTISFTPIGTGNITIKLGSISKEIPVISNTPISLSFVNSFQTPPTLEIYSSNTIIIANLQVTYSIPSINKTIYAYVKMPYSPMYQLNLAIDGALKQGNIYIEFPNGEYTINSSEISPLETIDIPASYFQQVGNYSVGEVKIISNGLYIVKYVSIS